MTDKPESETTAGLSVGEVLPVVVWVSPGKSFSAGWRMSASRAVETTVALTARDPAQATIDAQAAEIERLKEVMQERALQALSDDGQWMEETGRLRAEITALKAKQVADIDEVMRLAKRWGDVRLDYLSGCTNESPDAAREALRSALAARGME